MIIKVKVKRQKAKFSFTFNLETYLKFIGNYLAKCFNVSLEQIVSNEKRIILVFSKYFDSEQDFSADYKVPLNIQPDYLQDYMA